MSKKTIVVERLSDITKEDFAAFGQIVGLDNYDPLEDFEHLNYWTQNVNLTASHDQIDLGLLLAKPMEPGFRVKEMERHPSAWEIFFPLKGQFIFVLAPTDLKASVPDNNGIRAFFMDGSLGVALPNGNWHWPPVAVGGPAKMSILRIGHDLTVTNIASLENEIELVM